MAPFSLWSSVQKQRQLVPVLLLLTLAAGIDFESAHVLTVCDAERFSYTTDSSSVPDFCPDLLPSPSGLFRRPVSSFVSDRCTKPSPNPVPAPDSTPQFIERIVQFFKRALDGARDAILRSMQTIARDVLKQNERWNFVSENWNYKWFTVASLFMFVALQYVKNQLIKNLITGFLTTFALYCSYLFSGSYFTIIVSCLFSIILVNRRVYVLTRMQGLGVLTLFHLSIPVLNSILGSVISVTIVCGPLVNLFVNGLSVFVHLLCLAGLFVDEKLLVIKTIFFPFYTMFTTLFHHNESNERLISAIHRAVDELTINFLQTNQTVRLSNKTIAELDVMLLDRLRFLCTDATHRWYESCPKYFNRSCVTTVDQTVINQIEQGFENVGQELTNFFAGINRLPVQRKAAVGLCQKMADSACRAIDINAYCTPNVESLYGRAYNAFLNAINRLKQLVMFRSDNSLATLFDSLMVGTQQQVFESPLNHIKTLDFLSWVRCFLSVSLGCVLIFLILKAFYRAIVFIHLYRTDSTFCNYTRKSNGRTSFLRHVQKVGSFIQVLVFYSAESVLKWLHSALQSIDFNVPEEGTAKLIFNVQGDGTLAKILRALLGSLSVHNNYCSFADSSVCRSPFFPVGWLVWSVLFALSTCHFLIISWYDSKEKLDYLSCRVCDRFIRSQAVQRARAKLEIEDKNQQLRRRAIELLAKEALNYRRIYENRRILNFYVSSKKMWYRNGWVPVLFRSLIAYKLVGFNNLFCQICFDEEIVYCFACGNLLLCRTCFQILKRCPCRNGTYRGECQPIQI